MPSEPPPNPSPAPGFLDRLLRLFSDVRPGEAGTALLPKQVGDRLFPLIAIGATAGSPVGSWVAEELFKADVHLYNMLHITVAILVVHLILYWLVNRREASRAGQVRGAAQTTLGGPGGFSLVFNSPYLRLIALLLVLLNLVNTTGE